MNAAQFAAVLDVTPRRVRQMLDEGLLVTNGRSIQAIPSLVKLLGAAKEKSKVRTGREALVRAQIAAAQIRAERLVKRWLTIEEFGEVIAVLLNHGYGVAQSESSLLYHQLCGEAPETTARIVATRFKDRVTGIFNGLSNGSRELKERILQDLLNNRSRIDHLIAKYLPGDNDDEDQHDQGETPDEAPTAEEVTGRPKRRRVKAKT